MNFDSVLRKRCSIRKYSTKKVSQNEIMKVVDASRFSPMAGNIPTVRLIIVDDEKKKAELAESALQQYFIADAPYILVVCSDITRLARSYKNQVEKYARQQAGAAIENMLLKIVDIGLASCWIGAFDEEKVKSILNIPVNIHVEALLPIGKPIKEKIRIKIKPGLKMITYFNKWGQREIKPQKKPPAY
jgi:nitroreductase